MESHLKALGFAVALALCGALPASSGYAQEAASNARSDRDALRDSGLATGDSGRMNGRADTRRNDSGGGRGVGPSESREGDTAHAGSPVRAGLGSDDASRKGATAPAGAPGATSVNLGASLSHDVDPIRLEATSASLQHRANRKSLIANLPKMHGAPPANAGALLPLRRSSAEGSAARNAVGVVVPSGGSSFVHAVPGSTASAGIGVRSVGVSTATGGLGGADARRWANPPNPAASPAAQGSGINGSTMGHFASSPSYIGGPARDRSGINGTAMRPRH